MRASLRLLPLLLAACAGRSPAAEPSWLEEPTLTEPKVTEAPEAEGAEKPSAKAEAPPPANLVENGDFERGSGNRARGWEGFDGLASFWVEGGPTGRGKCLRVDTDVYLEEWEDHRRDLKSGKRSPAPRKKTPTSGPKYDTVAGTKGIHIYSEPVKVSRGERYMLSAAMKGPSAELFFPKVFVKGYRELDGQAREVWRAPLHCRTKPGEWQVFKWKEPKDPSRYGVTEIKVIVYCYWPPGVYEADDVRLWKVED